jgi:hypothetical protein
MNLIPHDEQPGLWVNKDWQPGTPGTFAMVIGISDYAALDGSRESLNLGKLPVSALSAFRFFEWLENEYFVSGCPLAMCWLLLSPSKAELLVAPRMAQAPLSPDYDFCYTAIQDWFDEMKKLPTPAANESRSIFFFSGHGLEIINDRQILLPRDYQPARNVDRALSSENIRNGLKDLTVPLHFLFLDACRKDHDKLSEYTTLTGSKVLNEPSNKRINSLCKVQIFYACASGTTAWSPDLTKGVVSVFSQALLEGLEANGLEPDCKGDRCFIYIHLLLPFMEGRMKEILRSRYLSSESQEPRVGGDLTVKPVTELSGPQPQDGLPPKPPKPYLDFGGPSLPGSGEAIGIPLQANTPGKISDDEMRSYLDGAGIYDFSSKAWLPDGSIEITNLRRREDTNLYEFDIRIRKAAKGQLYWLELSNKTQTVGCALPVDWVDQTVFHASAHAASRPYAVARLDITLSENSGGLLRKAMQLWQRSDRGLLTLSDLQTSFLETPFAELRSGIERHTVSSLGSMITASILSRTAQWKLLGDWALALTTVNPKMTDGAILWAERCLRQDDRPVIEPLKYFMLMDTGTLPILSHTISLALRQAEYYSSLNTLPDPFRAGISRIHRRLARAVGTFRPGGLFASFIGKVGQVSSETIAAPAVADEFRVGLSRAALKAPGVVKKVSLQRNEDEISVGALGEVEQAVRMLREYEDETAAAEATQPKFTAETES